ncbi:hypothetical protein [Serratia rubidaea]|uniref:Uncharacterized protein n=1 Tax=Serratia rubidaea TaxID=61652 RepID=A0A3S4X5G2_SERRU|nr:hypothetical protein [Serratia rubidaea]MBH1931420.1 hypothetical protein [Serratia rubidaea]MDC6119511.1 hypothetical protein [Serratia rubidaea]MEB7584600.1 hypothetical protein [Serratia rubidaea]VEI71484.1 Uncharacterised protein [Serratia rubidaea]
MKNSNAKVAEVVKGNYELKSVEIAQNNTRAVISISARDLDASRMNAAPVSASKFGLEILCGASCAVGAM